MAKKYVKVARIYSNKMRRINNKDEMLLNRAIEKIKAYNGIAMYKKHHQFPSVHEKGGFQAQKTQGDDENE